MAVNGRVAPVCPISRPQTPPAQRGIAVPFVPRAYDLASAIQAVNALAMTVNTAPEANVRWKEKERVTQRVRITNPDDDSQWVDVIRITKLIMQDVVTDELWVWEL
jgi:hypothetical protein